MNSLASSSIQTTVRSPAQWLDQVVVPFLTNDRALLAGVAARGHSAGRLAYKLRGGAIGGWSGPGACSAAVGGAVGPEVIAA